MCAGNWTNSKPSDAMVRFLRDNWQLIMVMIVWLGVGYYFQSAVFLLLPLSVVYFKSRDLWPEILMGLLMVLIFSDIEKDMFYKMIVFKDAKDFYVLTVGGLLLLELNRFAPLSQVFAIFLPFFLYSLFPLVFSNNMLMGFQKTVSYALMYLIVPNYLLYNFRRLGWPFMRNLIFFMTAILIAGMVLWLINEKYATVAGRFRGIFGNPNGMAIFCYLFLMFTGVVVSINKDLFTVRERVVIFGIIIYFIIVSGSRASLASALIFLIFHRFFAASPFLGFVGLLCLFMVVELVSSNLQAIIASLGLQEYFRVETIEDGSGRYFAWHFSWQHIQRFFVFGGGFANDENIMHKYRLYLESMGHQGGVHNTYLSFWLNTGLLGLLIFLRSLFLLFIKASKLVPMSLAVLFSVLFSIMYESWLMGSLNPYTIVLLMVMTVVTEPEIANWKEYATEEGKEEAEPEEGALPAPAMAL